MHGTTTAELNNVAVVPFAGKQVQEPVVRLVAQVDYDPKSNTLQLIQCELTSTALTAGGRRPRLAGWRET